MHQKLKLYALFDWSYATIQFVHKITVHAPCVTYFHLHFGATDLADQWNDTKWQRDILCGAIPHQFELAVRRNKADGMFGFEFAQLDALMKLAIVDDDHRFARARRFRFRIARNAAAALRLHNNLIVDAEFTFRHTL